eukprot:CAMPEP_0181445630 /NCGR_PEP_ID=MMETSP1110-20121109/25687_1 /TAXON_ID=174948 /ORGANISM="Symbiodinium sp., Strain CCMP421" /LENGTH=715 /DNA_ID=CAMNT_0023569681 /DNA_START=39 /DNA_END=2186 /DNA_ORIENTATION=+
MAAGRLVFASLVARAAADASPTGSPTCPCVEWAGLQQYIQGGTLMYTPPGSSTSYEYPSNYGNLECKAHDTGLAPHCAGTNPPAWCNKPWCYVSKGNCNFQAYKSVKFPGADAYYSYRTCGQSNEFALWSQSLAEGTTSAPQVTQLLDVVTEYLWSTRDSLEQKYIDMLAGNVSACNYVDFCPCLECYSDPVWPSYDGIDPSTVGAWLRPGSVSLKEQNLLSCLVGLVADVYSSIAAKEGEPDKRVGYMYFADQLSGSYMGWPTLQWCPTNYDPRFRPWYASGSTGPKDVIIVVDVSGSMGAENRYNLAKQATRAVLDTLDWKDYATVILFNHGIAAQYSSNMVAVSDTQRGNMQRWLESQNWQQGSTNFKVALNEAFSTIQRSVAAGTTSMCQKAIIFLTDGEAEFLDSDFRNIQEQSVTYDTVLFTYALGSGADTTVTKRLACENRGIFYNVPDGSDLSSIMSSYYEYFATGQEICQPSFTSYADVAGGGRLWPACLPIYDRSRTDPSLLGVTCMDFNMMEDPANMQSESYWDYFSCKISDITKVCQALDTSECRLQRLRAAVGQDSVCSTTASVPASCPCMDPDCQDDESFIDEKGYFCDTWVGDDCSKAQETWGYSAAGQQAALTRCRRSCGRCQMISPCPSTARCAGTERFADVSCRACRTDKVSGIDIEGRSMVCPGTPRTDDTASPSASSRQIQLGAFAVAAATALLG